MEPTYRGIEEAEREQAAALMMLGFGHPHRADYARRTVAEEFRVLAGWGPLGGYVQWSGPDPDPAMFASTASI